MQREVLRLLFFFKGYTASPVTVAERTYYTDVEVADALPGWR